MAATGQVPDMTGSPQFLPFSTDYKNDYLKTTATTAGESIKALYSMEIKATEAISIKRMFRQMTILKVGTIDLEKTATRMASQDHNKRGKLLKEGGGAQCNQLSVNVELRPSVGAREEEQVGQCQLGDQVDEKYESGSKDVETTEAVTDKRCSREPRIVARLAAIKEEQTSVMAGQARKEVWMIKKKLKTQVTSDKYKEILVKVGKARTRAWKKAQEKHKRKIDFLVHKVKDCCAHHHCEGKRDCDNNKSSVGSKLGEVVTSDPLILGTATSDKDLDKMFLNKEERHMFNEHEVMVYGDVDLDDDERLLLQRRPEFAIYDSILDMKISEEMNLTLTKIRWDRESRGLSQQEQEEEESLFTQEEKKEIMEQEERQRQEDSQSRIIFDQESNTINMGARRATDMKHNSRLIMPQPRPPMEEAIQCTRQEVWKSAVSRYKVEHCNKTGVINVNNLNDKERVGLNKLRKRVKEGEITILKADKGNRFVVSSLESFERQGDAHTECDRKCRPGEKEQIQTRLNNLSRGVSKVFKIGENWGDNNASRCWSNLTTEACVAPLLYPSPKIHKSPDDKGDPRSRPVVQASSCLTSRPGEIVADVLEAALQSLPVTNECQSTEDMLSRIDKARHVIEDEGINICVGSGDVKALYPSLLHKPSAKFCGDLIRNCPADFKVDAKAAGIFVATHMSRTDVVKAGLGKVVPVRKHAKGRMPQGCTWELKNRLEHPNHPSKFREIGREITKGEERLLIAMVIEIAVLMIIRNHVYSWKGQCWVQTKGVPTGLRLSGIIGRITMDVWSGRMSRILGDNGFKVYLQEKYVDDVDTLVENLPPGARWKEDKITFDQADAEEDKDAGTSKEEVTMNVWGKIASTLVPGVEFTVDFPANHKNGRVPVLYFEVWCEETPVEGTPGETKQTVMYSFFEKEVSNPKVMDRESAIPHKMMIATMTQEGVRRLLNMSRDLPDTEKCEVLSKYMRKLQLSNYSQALRENILQSAVATYRKKLRAEELGIRPLHREGGHDAANRRRAKITARESWYKTKTNCWKKRLAAEETRLQSTKGATGQHNTRAGQTTDKVRGQEGTERGHKHRTLDKSSTERRTEGILFVPHTPGGKLAQEIQRDEDNFSTLHKTARVKVVERGGKKLIDILGRKDPWAPQNCGRSECLICSSRMVTKKDKM